MKAFLCTGAVAIGVHLLLSNDLAVYDAIALSSAGVMLVAVAAHRPRRRAGWLALAVSQLCYAGGDILYAVVSTRSPGPSDVGYLAGDVAIVLGMVLLAAGTTRIGIGTAIDALLVTTAVGLALWALLFDETHRSGVLATAVNAAYPAVDLLLLAILVGLLLVGGRRSPSYWLLVSAVVLLLVADVCWDIPSIAATVAGTTTGWLDAGWLGSYLLFAAAALHPSMHELVEDARPEELLPYRRVLLIAATLIAAPLAVLAEFETHHRIDIAAIACVSTFLVLLAVARVLFLVRSIDELRRQAVESERKFRMMFERAPIGISIGRNGIMSETNPALQRLLGYSAEELARTHFLQVTHPDDRNLSEQAELDAGRQSSFSVDKRYVAKDGTVIPTHVNIALDFEDGLGISLVEDVTQRRVLEEQLRQSQKLEAVGKLAGGVAHDFNNLMTAVIGYSDLLVREPGTTARTREKIAAIRDAAVRASDLTRQLLAFSRQQVLRLDEVDLRSVVSEMDTLLRRLIGDDVELETDLGDDPVVVRADATQLQQVVMNLAVNARDAMPGGGSLMISVRREGDSAVLVVADQGTGMDDETRARVFEPYFTTKPIGRGSGLGLSTVHGIVGQSGGSVEVTSAVGVGTTFTVRLPLATLRVVARAAAR